MTASLLEEFLVEECTPHVVAVLTEGAAGRSEERYFTFNRFNVRLDPTQEWRPLRTSSTPTSSSPSPRASSCSVSERRSAEDMILASWRALRRYAAALLAIAIGVPVTPGQRGLRFQPEDT
jgi:hypothetical protein